MTLGDWMFAFIIVIVVIAAAVCAVAWKVAFQDGREAGILHERNMRNTERIRRNRLEAATDEFWGTTEAADPFDDWIRRITEEHAEHLADTGELRTITDDSGQPDNLTTTGSFRALTDDWIAQMTREEAAYREGLAS